MVKSRPTIIALSLLLAFAVIGCQKSTAEEQQLQQGADFTLKDINGGTVSLADFKGKVIILDFFATWCPPCLKEVPHFIALHDKYKDKGAMVIGISVDFMDAKGLRIFANEQKVNYPVLLNSGTVTKDYGPIQSIPTTVVLDKEGKIARRYIGYREQSVFEADIQELLK